MSREESSYDLLDELVDRERGAGARVAGMINEERHHPMERSPHNFRDQKRIAQAKPARGHERSDLFLENGE